MELIAEKPLYFGPRRGAIAPGQVFDMDEYHGRQLLAEGKSNKDVAAMLNLSTNTVETHRTRLMQKLGLHSTADIVLYAVRKRIIS